MIKRMASVNKELKDIEKRRLKAVRKDDFAEASKLCNSAGELLSSNGMYLEAIEWHKEELHFSEVCNDIIGTAISHRKIGECCCELGKFDLALKHQKLHLQLAESINNQVEEQRALATIGRTLFVQSDNCDNDMEKERCLLESQEAYLKSLSLCDQLKNEVTDKEILEMRARLCLNLGLVFEWRNKLDQAEKFMKKALISSRENGLKQNMYRCYLSLSGVTAKNNKLQEALRFAKKAQHLAMENGNKVTEADAVFQIGQILIKLGEFSAAVEALRQSYKLSAPTDECERDSLLGFLKLAVRGETVVERLEECISDDEKLECYEKLGDIYGEAKSPLKALQYYDKQLELSIKLDKSLHSIAAIFVSLAVTYAENGDAEKALEYYHKELEIRNDAVFSNEFKEKCATYAAIAKLQEDNNSDKDIVKATYEKALECAKESGSISCQIRVYKELGETLQKFNELDELKMTEEKIKELQNEEVDSEDESQSSKQEEVEDIEYLLGISDNSDEEADRTNVANSNNKPGSNRRRRRNVDKLNEKGETPLQVACINGNVKRVQELLEKGASVHCRDYCGWQPLHEACNFGHTEIVKLLLLYGANVNDPGGDHCGKVTPLHDAAQNGHLETVQYLIGHGGDPYLSDTHGKNALDYVEAAIQADEEELEDSESDVLHNRRKVRNFLKHVMSKSKPQSQLRNRNILDQEYIDESSTDESDSDACMQPRLSETRLPVARCESATRRNRDKCSQSQTKQSAEILSTANTGKESVCQPVLVGPVIHEDLEPMDTDGDSTYASMDEDGATHLQTLDPLEPLSLSPGRDSLEIQTDKQSFNVPSTNQNDSQDSFVISHTNSVHQLSHIMQDNCAFRPGSESDTDDLIEGFIIDDIGERQSQKRRRYDNGNGKKIQSRITIVGQSNTNPKRKKSSVSLNRVRAKRQTRITTSYNTVKPATREGFQVNTAPCSATSTMRSNAMLGVTSSSFDRGHSSRSESSKEQSTDLVHNFSVASNSSLMRIRVRVERETFLIPCGNSTERRTVKWLADQASQRYASSAGLCPKLSLKTEHGASLCPDDLVSDVLLDNEEVFAAIDGWDAGSVCRNYERECALLRIAIRDDIVQALSPGETLTGLNMTDFNLSIMDIRALTKSLPGHSRLSKIDLTGNYLGDSGIKCLCHALQYLPNLSVLVLACTGMTSSGLCDLSDAFSQGCKFGKDQLECRERHFPLEELDCSYNSFLQPHWFSKALSTIIKCCKKLMKLVLDHCCIDPAWVSYEPIVNALQDSTCMKTLSIAGNLPYDADILIPVMHKLPNTLEELDISECTIDNEHRDPTKHSQSGDNLQISTCLRSLTIKDIQIKGVADFALAFSKTNMTRNLQKLDISGASFYPITEIQNFLRSIAEITSLKNLDLSGIESLESTAVEYLLKCMVASQSSLKSLKTKSCSIEYLSSDFCRLIEEKISSSSSVEWVNVCGLTINLADM